MALIEGTEGNDTLFGTSEKDYIEGFAGDDLIWGNEGDDTIYGDNGNDYLDGGDGNDLIKGGDGDDTIEGHDGNDDIDGDDGNDYINGGADDDSITGGNGNDTILGGDGNDIIYGDDGDDDIGGGAGDDTIFGGAGIDIIYGGAGGDYIDGGESPDSIEGGEGNDTIYGGAGNDDIHGNEGNDHIWGGTGNDHIWGEEGDDYIDGGDGNDYIDGGTGDDSITGGNGNDTIIGGAGDDTITGGTGHNRIEYIKGDGHDTIILTKNENLDIYLSEFDKTDNITYKRSENNLVISVNEEEIITIKDFVIKDITGKYGSVNLYKNKILITDLKELNIFTYNNNSFTVENKNYDGNLKDEKITAVSLNKKKIENFEGAYINAYDGNDTITGSKYNDIILGGEGNDIIKAGSGDDILNGGSGDDKLYGEKGNNIYVFDNHSQGNDTIYTTGKGKTIIDFSDTDLIFSENSVNNALEKYSYTKSKNDLIINYATNEEENGKSSITISNYFKSKNEFLLVDKNHDLENALNLKDFTIFIEGTESKQNKLTGSQYNDYILGGSFNDVLKGGNGNDTICGKAGDDKIYGGNGDDSILGGSGNDKIYSENGDDIIIGGQGDDTITGGKGHNIIEYAKGDGFDTINLTKNENLDIKLTGFENQKNLTYKIVKNDFVIGYLEDGIETEILKLKNFAKKDVTTANGSVRLYLDGTMINDLRKNNNIIYTDFTAKKNSCTGTWLSEIFDATSLNFDFSKNNKGAKINAGDGNDVIYGSRYNDTLNGGNGNDEIYTGGGKNTVNGGNGSDTYYIFEDTGENTTIKDTGKGKADVDTVVINGFKEKCDIWFNIDKKGKITKTFNVTDTNNNSATLTGIEKIVANGGTADDTSDDFYFDYTSEKLKNDVVSWLNENGYANVNSVMSKGLEQDQNALLAIFEEGWTQA